MTDEAFYCVTVCDQAVDIVGPFSAAEASSYGEAWQASRGDDPRWNTICVDQLKVSILGVVEARLRLAWKA